MHKETIDKVPNALSHRSNIEIEIYGMEGIPEEDMKEHERQKSGSKGLNLINYNSVCYFYYKFCDIHSVFILLFLYFLNLGTRSDSDDESSGPPTKKKPEYSNPAGPSMMPTYNPMMNHMQPMGAPYMGPG